MAELYIRHRTRADRGSVKANDAFYRDGNIVSMQWVPLGVSGRRRVS